MDDTEKCVICKTKNFDGEGEVVTLREKGMR